MFSNLIVVELASVLAGPAVGQFFAELGARVLKVENPHTGGDVTRSWKLAQEDPESDICAYFSCVNWGKQSIALDARSPEGLRNIRSLAAQADIVISSYKPGDAAKLGLDYPCLQALKADLIYAEVSGFGTEDTRAGYDAIVQAEAGFTWMNGQADGPPTKMPVALMDVLSGHHLKEALLLALLHKFRTGKGGHIRVSLLRAGVASLANQAANWLVGGTIPGRMGSEHPNVAPYGSIFAARDGLVVLAVGNDGQFRRLCTVLRIPATAADVRFANNAARVQNNAALKELLAAEIVQWPRAELLAALHNDNVPAGAVKHMPDVMEHPEAQALALHAQYRDGRDMRGLRSIAFTADFLPQTGTLTPPPHFDEHAAEIRRQFLGGT